MLVDKRDVKQEYHHKNKEKQVSSFDLIFVLIYINTFLIWLCPSLGSSSSSLLKNVNVRLNYAINNAWKMNKLNNF